MNMTQLVGKMLNHKEIFNYCPSVTLAADALILILLHDRLATGR